ncbi:hypothetical protein [Glycomyces buryatensis]|uniref:hypothetical protein n=1 Tax=Glycomyces buryatensis TaxID=2570927 RepID=UPI001B3C154C|nr:hypothetical protein [Glycomyces buryatensis]
MYAKTAVQMMVSEIRIFDEFLLDGSIKDLEEVEMGGIPYLTFHGDSLSERDLRCLANVSSLFALFKIHGSMLEPIALSRLDRYENDLTSILKYVGKTNEHFTKLLLNVTAAAAFPADRVLNSRFKVLDPLCGRGTTLNQSIMYGWDSYGVEVDKRDFEAYSAFIQRWLKSKSIKHKAVKSRVKRDGRAVGQRLLVEFAATKELYKAGEMQTLEMVSADTLQSGQVYKKRSFDLIVTDAPYGVQHAAVGAVRSLSRTAKELLELGIPVWTELLRGGGAIGIAWNTLTVSRDELAAMLTESGLEVMSDKPFLGFAHRVDQAINRDLIVAVRP